MKNLLLVLPVFIWLQACSQAPGSEGSTAKSTDTLPDSASILGDSPDHAFRLFKSVRTVNGQSVTDLKVLRLQDLQQALVATMPSDAKYFVSADSKFLIAENSVPDSSFKREIVVFDLLAFSAAYRKPGNLLGFDVNNQMVFFHRTEPTQQFIVFFHLDTPTGENQRAVSAPPVEKLPSIILSPKDRRVKVKIYTTDNVPVNIAFNY